MSRRISAGIVAIVAVIVAGVAFYKLHGQSNAAPPTLVPAPAASLPVATPGMQPEKIVATSEPPARPAEAKRTPPEPETGIPLRAGEVLEYAADVAKVSNVANLRLLVSDRRSFLGKSAWHLQAFAHTENPLRMVFELDDQFDSYSEAGSLSSLQYEMHLSERGQKVDSVQRLTATGKDPAPPNVTEARVLPGTRDPLGMMQYLRNVDWSKTPEVRGPVYDGRKLYDVRAVLAGSPESVTVPAGTFTASKVEIHVFEDGAEMKDAHFSLYLARDEARTPVLLEAVMPWTTARVGLKTKK